MDHFRIAFRQFSVKACLFLWWFCLVSGMTERTAWGMERGLDSLETASWEEEYTDTDRRRGILAIRLDAFQGFQGNVYMGIRRVSGNRQWEIVLDEETHYMYNLELPVGEYELIYLKSDSTGREFKCQVETDMFEVEEEGISLCEIHISPESIYKIPDASDEFLVHLPVNGEGNAFHHISEEGSNEERMAEADMEDSHDDHAGWKAVGVMLVICVLGMIWPLRKRVHGICRKGDERCER